MRKEAKNEIRIENISLTNIHHQSDTGSPICSIIQLESGVVIIGLFNGKINLYSPTNFENPTSSLKIDDYPISCIIQVQDDQLMCCSGSFIYLILENKLKKNDYNKKERINVSNISGRINKIIILPDDSLIIGDNRNISLFRKKEKKINYIKQIKIKSAINDLCLIQNNMVLGASIEKKSLIFVDIDKFVQNYEMKNIKFYDDIKFGKIICKLNKNIVGVGGCKGLIYLISLKNKQFVANVNIRYCDEIITSMFAMPNGNLLCGVSILVKEKDSNQEYINSNLVQYSFVNNVFKEIYRKLNAHEDIINNVCEIINYRGIGEIGSISLDSKFKVWN